MEERLQKVLARTGLGSRRSCENLIAMGRVSVNGEIAKVGSKADPQKDRILVDNKPISMPKAFTYIALHKPKGVLSTVVSPDNRKTVLDLVEKSVTLYPVGRLDFDSEGLILLTNDGELTNRLTHPRYGHEKEYRVLVSRPPDEEQLDAWRRGIVLEDGHQTAPARVSLLNTTGKGTWLKIIITEGRKRQIRQMGIQTGLPVLRIIRTRIGPIQIGRLTPGEWRYLTAKEVATLKAIANQEKTRNR